MRREKRNRKAKSRFMAGKNLPSFYDRRIEQKRNEIEMAETGQIGKGFEFKEEDGWEKKLSIEKSKSTRERKTQAGPPEQELISFLRLRYVRRDDKVRSGSVF